MDKIILIGYGLFLLLGAYFGWKAGSKPSLIMGSVSSLLVFLGIYMTGANPKTGFLFLSLIGFALTVVFIMRLVKTQKFMPAGMLLIVTLLYLTFCILQYLKNR